jgi:hypothetical protein
MKENHSMGVQSSGLSISPEDEPSYVAYPVARERVVGPQVRQLASRLHAVLPRGEANNRIAIVEQRVPGQPLSTDPEQMQALGVFTLRNAYAGRLVINVDPTLNGHTQEVQDAMISHMSRVATAMRVTHLEVVRPLGQGFAVNRAGSVEPAQYVQRVAEIEL